MFDLVFLMRRGDYLHPLRDTLEERLRSDGWGASLGSAGRHIPGGRGDGSGGVCCRAAAG